jgi:hypothetical protein
LRLPKTSESEAAGRLIRMPGMVDADATMPSKLSGVPKLVAKGFNTGFFDMVELRIANKPIAHSVKKNAFDAHLVFNMPNQLKALVAAIFCLLFPRKECGLLMVFSFLLRVES